MPLFDTPHYMPKPPQQPEAADDGLFGKVMKDPWFRLGMALLEQAGPQDKPHSVGQDISRAVAGVQNQQDQDALRKQRTQKLAMMQQSQQMAQGMLGSLGSPEGMGEASGPPAAITPPNVAPAIDPTSNPNPGVRASFKVPAQYEPMLRRASQMYGVPYEILAAQAHHESAGTWDPNVKGTSGELGIPQFMPATAKQYGLIGPQGDMRNNPEMSFNAQARFMRELADKNGGDWGAALHRYNASPGNPMGKKYADKVLGIAGMAPQAADTIDAPAPQAVPTRPAGPPAKLPPELHRMFLAQAYAEGMGDPVATVQAYYKLANAWQMENMKSSTGLTSDFAKEDYKARLARETDDLKLKNEVSQADDKKFNEDLGKMFAERYADISKQGQSAQKEIDRLNMLDTTLSRVYTGKGGDTVKELVKIGAALGFELDEQAAATDVAESLINNMALSFRSTANGEGMPGAMSDADRQFLMSLPPGFEKTPQGNKVLIEFYKRAAKRKQEVARMARDYRKKNGRFDDDFDDVLDEYYVKNPLFKDGEVIKMLGGGGKMPAGAVVDGHRFKGGNPKDPKNWEPLQ